MTGGRHYQEVVQYLYGLQRLGIKFGLENVTRLLEGIGSPHRKLRVVHIAGSNGKGSTAAHLESILMRAGYRVGLYTSPHFVRFTERIRVNREPISEQAVIRWTEASLDALPELRAPERQAPLPITFFEFTTAMAMAYFVHQGVDLAILEVGMGGRLDATNVCYPLVCAVVTVCLEHSEFLGTTIAAIAREKAGIIKPRIPMIMGAMHPHARDVLEEVARQKGAPLYRLGRDFKVRGGPEDFAYEGLQRAFRRLRTSLKGRHQVRNAGLALALGEVLASLGYPVDEESMRGGMEDVQWRGRQEFHRGPPQVLLDGAHNPQAMRSLLQSLKRDYRFERLRLLMGVMREKDHRRMIQMLSPLAHEFVFCRPNMDRSQDPWVLQAEALRLGCRATVVEAVAQGFQDLLERAAEGDLVCVTGSLFAVGEVLAWLEKNPLSNHRSLA